MIGLLSRLVILALSAMMIVIAPCRHAQAERRVALIVGNSDYMVARISLPNPKNDAQDIAALLKELEFDVVMAVNANKREIDLKLAEFARKATDADTALFYYAGHALQLQGRNFLMPVDADLEDEFSVQYQMVALDYVRTALDRVNNGVKIMILDACRNNPLANRVIQKSVGLTRSIGETTRGLARIDKTQGMVIAYATAADDVAEDGGGRNSPFTAALLRRLREPGLEIATMFRRIASDVNAQTGGRQRPELTINLLDDYYLNQNDRMAWERTNQDDPAALRDFISKYPSSPHAVFARNRLDLMERYAREREDQRKAAEERRQDEQKRLEQQRLAALQQQAERVEAQTQADAAQKRIVESCNREQATFDQFKASQAAGADIRTELKKFEIESTCMSLRPLVADMIASLAVAPAPEAAPVQPKAHEDAAPHHPQQKAAPVEVARQPAAPIARPAPAPAAPAAPRPAVPTAHAITGIGM